MLFLGGVFTSCVNFENFGDEEFPSGIQNPPQQRYGQRADGGVSPTNNGSETRKIVKKLQNQYKPPQNTTEELVQSVDNEIGEITTNNRVEQSVSSDENVIDSSQPLENTPITPQTPQYPYASQVPGSPGTVYSPFVTGKKVDVSGYAPGTKVTDPHTGKVFLVP